MKVRVLAFARVREILHGGHAWIDLPQGARIDDLWAALEVRFPLLNGERRWVRVACNGRLVDERHSIGENDEIALLPPVGGG